MGSKTSQHSSKINEPLNPQIIEELRQDTGFTEDELRTLHTNFYKDCPDGKLTLKQFEHEYSKIMGKLSTKTLEYVKHMFHVYDQDNNQFIDFKEYVMALSAASVVNRLRLVETLFSIFDLDSDGKISKNEMEKMFHTLVDVTNSNRKHHHHHHRRRNNENTKQINLQKRLDDAFNELNSNADEYITKDEFIEWYIKSGLVSDVQSNQITMPNNSRIQQLNKKSRKIKRQQHRKDEQSQPIRYISHMTEQRTTPVDDDDDDDDDNNNNLVEHSIHPEQKNSIDNKSYYSKENERWQYLFNSVLGQIRVQRSDAKNNDNVHSPISNNFNSWKGQDEKNELTSEYNGEEFSNVVTIRF